MVTNAKALDEMDRAMARQVRRRHARAFALLDELTLLGNHGTAVLTGTPHDRGPNLAIGLFCARTFNTLYRARQDLMNGYPIQALMLARAALEDWIAAIWVESAPSRSAYFLSHVLEEVDHPVNTSGKQRLVPLADEMIRSLPPEQRGSARSAYRELSKYAHPRGDSLNQQFHLNATTNALDIHVGPSYDRDLTLGALRYLVLIAAGILPAIERLEQRWLGSADRQWVKRCVKAVSEADEFIGSAHSA